MDNWALNDGQKTRLLSLALERDNPAAAPSEDEQKGNLLRDILRCALPLEAPAPSTDVGLCPPYGGLRAVAGPRLDELLLDRATDLVALKRIKEYAKALGKNAKSGIERDVFLAVYFAAIAAARVSRQECITAHTDEDLTQSLRFYAKVAWMPSNLKDLLVKAAEGCAQKPESSSTPKP
jgi:hypothetical protein